MIAAEQLWWIPIAAVLGLIALGLVAVRGREPGRRRRPLAAILLFGAVALAATVWQEAASRQLLAEGRARLQEVASLLDQLGRSLPEGPGHSPAETVGTASGAIRALNARIEDLQEQIRTAKEKFQTRHLEPDTAAQVAAYLRQYGPYRVVVSTVPGDVEAFTYANQLANVLREAGWEARGPETTTIFGTPAYPGITLVAPQGAAGSKAVSALADAFARFNIPYRSGIAPSDAIPDPATIALFVSRKS
jgi:hypothetical protein